ncbi:MAG TPA: helix-turn-helix domain-containing protein [Streptosporangiaceae bacterium]|jgi:DNA-binding HxlR family transcriptional regulator|nr:helix-turn-helix domain-containing protein [Streptosporangiaceae bacterium]
MPYTEIVLNRTYPGQACSIARALEIVGERWTLLILRDTYRGTRRFDDLHASLGITRGVLAARLSRLVEEGLLERRPYQDSPERFEYHPTAKGRELWPVLMHLMLWGDRYYSAPDGPPQTAEHDGCGGRLTAELTCDRCGRRLGPGDVLLRPRHKAARAHGEAEPFSV